MEMPKNKIEESYADKMERICREIGRKDDKEATEKINRLINFDELGKKLKFFIAKK